MNERDDDDEAGGPWLVLVNGQGQHALWPLCRPAPVGWIEVGPEGAKAECLDYVAQHWTDLRPAAIQ